MTANNIQISRWTSLARVPGAAALKAGVTSVFQEAATSWPSDPAAAAAFRELWLDGYLREEPDLALVAHTTAAPDHLPHVVGYLVASTADPLTDPRFSSLGYFRAFAHERAAFPAHLHVNVAAQYRSQRIGERLVAEICAILAARGCPGVHIVTGAAARNTGFYRRCGFSEQSRTLWNGRDIVLMGRHLRGRPLQA